MATQTRNKNAPSAKAPPKKRATKRKRTDAVADGDHLALYFRELAEHELFTAEEERDIAIAIESAEIETWLRVLARPDVVTQLAKQYPDLAETGVFTRNSGRTKRALRARAAELRGLDLDRLYVDDLVRLLVADRTHVSLGEETVFWHRCGDEGAAAYVRDIQASQDQASNLRNDFIRANLRLVITMARRYDRGGMPLADLIQEGNLGLIHAVSRFDHRRGLRFSTYACWWIRHAVGRGLSDKSRTVRVPTHMVEVQQQIEKARQEILGEQGHPASLQEIATATKIPILKITQMSQLLLGQSMSLDRPVHDEDDRSFGDTLADPDTEDSTTVDLMHTHTLAAQVQRLMHLLTPVEADVITQRFGIPDDEPRTFRELADQYKLSRERIRQIQNSALDKLKIGLMREHRGHIDN